MIHDSAAFWLISPSFLSVIFSGDWERVVFPPHSSPPLKVQYRTTHTYVYANGSGENGGGGTNYCDGVISGKRMSIILYTSTHVFPSCHQQACLSLYVKSLSMHSQSKRKKRKRGCIFDRHFRWLTAAAYMTEYYHWSKNAKHYTHHLFSTLYTQVQPQRLEFCVVGLLLTSSHVTVSSFPPFSVINKSRENGIEMITN